MEAFSLTQLGLFALTLSAAAALQSSIGFAAGLMAIPLLTLAGATLPQAIAMSLVGAAVQTLLGAYRLRRLVSVRSIWRPVVIRTVSLPIGVYALWNVSELSPSVMKQAVGAVILLFVVVQWSWRVAPREQLHAGWEWLAFGCSGFTLGFCGMGGPPIVLWVMAHRWSSRRTRAFLFSVFITGIIPQALLLYLAFGTIFLKSAVVGLLLSPFVLLGSHGGLILGDQISKVRLRKIVYTILLSIGAGAVAAPFWS